MTGATDLANTLVRNKMPTVQLFGVPSEGDPVPDVAAIVIATKTRTAPVQQAIDESLTAARWLRAAGAQQLFYKYCSTFDSTPQGNIGPVTEALLEELGQDVTMACPAFPGAGRTLYNGYLFVDGGLLSESGMRNHPLTPMTDSNLVRVLAAQSKHPVSLINFRDVDAEAAAISRQLDELRADGVRQVIVDAVTEKHLRSIGEAAADMKLLTGGSGVAIGLPENFRRSGKLAGDIVADRLPDIQGFEAVIAGSCSEATLGQVQFMKERHASFYLDPLILGEGDDIVAEALSWVDSNVGEEPILVYSSAQPELVAEAQRRFGREQIAESIEIALARVAAHMVGKGVARLVVAGGETSGAVVKELGIKGLQIGPQIAPGVPWTATTGDPQIAIALKSGNFGDREFFVTAFERLN